MVDLSGILKIDLAVHLQAVDRRTPVAGNDGAAPCDARIAEHALRQAQPLQGVLARRPGDKLDDIPLGGGLDL